MRIRQLKVTKSEHQRSLYNPAILPKIIINGDYNTIYDDDNEKIVRIFYNILPRLPLDQLTTLLPQLNIKNHKPNAKGATKTFAVGHYIKRSGRGKLIHESETLTIDQKTQLIEILQPILYILAQILQEEDPEFYQALQKIPTQYRTLHIFSVFYCNLLPPPNSHKDIKDKKWYV